MFFVYNYLVLGFWKFFVSQVFLTPCFPETPADLLGNGDYNTARQSVLLVKLQVTYFFLLIVAF